MYPTFCSQFRGKLLYTSSLVSKAYFDSKVASQSVSQPVSHSVSQPISQPVSRPGNQSETKATGEQKLGKEKIKYTLDKPTLTIKRL